METNILKILNILTDPNEYHYVYGSTFKDYQGSKCIYVGDKPLIEDIKVQIYWSNGEFDDYTVYYKVGLKCTNGYFCNKDCKKYYTPFIKIPYCGTIIEKDLVWINGIRLKIIDN